MLPLRTASSSRAAARRRCPVVIDRSGSERLREQEREQVAQLLRPEGRVQPLGHDRGRRRGRRLDVRTIDDRLAPRRVTHDQPISLGAKRPVQDAAVGERDAVGDVIRIDGGAGRVDVAEHRGVIAVDEVREVGADLAAAAADLVAGRAL